jgi:hypothetical protein
VMGVGCAFLINHNKDESAVALATDAGQNSLRTQLAFQFHRFHRDGPIPSLNSIQFETEREMIATGRSPCRESRDTRMVGSQSNNLFYSGDSTTWRGVSVTPGLHEKVELSTNER